ncbi:GGDEF domain-containing protein [Methylocapsa sp. S129]|uniref:GGDEF domain-containing protein n=1 Tax=Methylocapsa sp. S129 TaxID=1641869 RepID=UPI00131D5543|nr:GGDEF domain-containing protein [Methylocapsa sp. S129]
MSHLIESVADLTARSDRDELEITLASVTAKLLCATRLTFWRIASFAGELRLQERVRLTEGRLAVSDGHLDLGDLPALEARADLRACYQSKTPIQLRRDENGQHGHVFPVASARGVVGFLEIYHPTPMGEDQHRLVSGLLSIYRNHLRILDYSEYDELTGLLNRKTFDGSLANFVRVDAPSLDFADPHDRIGGRRAANPDQQAWLAVLDIDFFKRINDRFGHLYGDEVLILLAQLMRSSFREADRLFRCGGEEFVVILAPTEADFAESVLERFRRIVEGADFPQVGRVTVSIGYTGVTSRDNGLTAFGRADEALYVAKRQGRNQVQCYEHLVTGGILQDRTLISADVEMF